MKSNKATGYDKLPVDVLKLSANNISHCLARIVNSSFEQAVLPIIWKIAKISLIFKEASDNNRDNCRPISLLPVLVNVCERVADNQVKDYGKNHQTLK